MVIGLTAAVAAAAAFGLAAVLQGLATATVATYEVFDLRLPMQLLRSRVFLASLACNLLGFALHLVALQSLPLFLVQAVIASSVAVTALISARVLRDGLSPAEMIAVAAVCVGLSLLAGAASEGAARADSGRLLPVLAVVVAGTAAVGAVLGHMEWPWSAGGLGLLAGVCFAIVAVGARLLPELSPGAVLRAPETYLVIVAGLVAFLLYAHAMQRGSVTRTTAAMVVTQTAVPAAVGIALLGDEVRDGYAGLGAVGFVLALTGAGVLIIRQPEPEPLT